MLYSQLIAEIEAFQLHLVTTIYGEGAGVAGKSECWTVVFTVVRVIWRDIRKFRVEEEMVYGSDKRSEMAAQYLWGALQTHQVIDEFLWKKFFQNTEMAPHIILYLFKHGAPLVEVYALIKNSEYQAKTLNQMENTCKEQRDKFYSLFF